jgi:DNA-binding transcriptional MerR regulator
MLCDVATKQERSDVQQEQWKVGQLSRLTGVSVRALHHYEEIGLLTPSGRNEAGYRLYNRDDVVRLGQIKLLQNLGCRLEEIRSCLTRPDFSPHDVVRMHLARLKEQMAWQQKLCARLKAVEAHLGAH